MATFLINFYPYDADAVADGTRRQVIRPHRGDGKRIREGDSLKLYQSLRTSFGRLIKEVRCAEVMSLRLDLKTGQLVVDGDLKDADFLHDLAVREGFVDGWHMRHQLGVKCHGGDFEGYCARW